MPLESEGVLFTVVGEADAPTRTGFELRVWHLSDPTQLVNVVPRHNETSVLEELNRRGGGGFDIRVDDQAITDAPELLQEGNLVEVILDGLTVFWWYIDTVNRKTIPSGEYEGEWFTVAGPGLYQILDHARLYPQGGFRKNAATMRYFNFSTPEGAWYDPSEWVNATTVTGNWVGFPTIATVDNEDGWPVTSAWIWDRNDVVMPDGSCYFRRVFTLAEETNIQIWLTSDDNSWVYMDGELITSVTEFNSWQKAYITEMTLLPGEHVIGVKASNVWGGPAGLNMAVIRIVDSESTTPVPITDADRIVWTGDGNWKVNSYPVGPPGWSAGLIVKTIYDEAVARGVDGFGAFTLNFDDEEDSGGVPWGENLDWAWDVGTSYLDILDELTATIVDSWIDSDRRLNLLPLRGSDRSIQNAGIQPVIFARTLNVTEAETQGSSEIRNVVLALTDEGFMETQGPVDSVNTYGRREAFLSFTQANELSVAPVLIQQVFDKFAFPQRKPSIAIISVKDHQPWVNVKVGDWVKAPDDDNPGQLIKRRVVSLAAKLMPSGQIDYGAELDTIAETREEQVERWLSAAARGAGRGNVEGTNTGGSTTASGGSGAGGGAAVSTGRPGPRGEPGQDGEDGATGPIGLVWRGPWNSATAYAVRDAVSYLGSSYYAVTAHTNQVPSELSIYWGILAKKGDTGATGATGALVDRDISTITTGSIGNNAHWQGTIPLAKGYRLMQIETDKPARVRLYTTPAKRTADVGRPNGTDPDASTGLMFQFTTTSGDLLCPLSPFVDGANMESTPTIDIPITVTNLSGSSGTIEVTLTFMITE